MTQFDPKALVPASTVAALSKTSTARTMKEIALAAIDKQVALLADPEATGKRSFRIQGEQAAFTIRVGNKALVLETVTKGPGQGEVTEMAVPTRFLADAFKHYRGKIDAGDYDAALTKLDVARDARVAKMRQTRAAKPKSTK